MSEQITIEQIKKNISAGKFSQAFGQLEVYLQYNPEPRAIKLYSSLKKKIYKQNLGKVKDGIKKSQFMWKQNNYDQILSLYLQLQKYAPNYRKLNRLISKAYKLQKQKEMADSNSVLTKISTTLKGYLDTKNYQEAINFIEESVMHDPKNPTLSKMLIDTKRKVIDNKLKENKALFKKADPIKVHDFLKTLHKMEPNYYKVQKLYFKSHQDLKEYYKNKKYIFEQDAKRQIKILYNQGELQKALQAINELLRAHNESKFAQKYLVKTREKIDSQNFREAYKKLKLSK